MITDYIVAGFISYFFLAGWLKGFFRTILGPLSLIAGCAAGYYYYLKTQNILTALTICILGPFLIHIGTAFLLKIYHKTVDNGQSISLLSRILGGIFSAVWGGSYLALLLVMTGLVPISFKWFKAVQENVISSKSYVYLQDLMRQKTPAGSMDLAMITKVFQNPSEMKKFESTPEFQAIANDPLIQNLVEDQEIKQYIESKNFTKLLSHPKIQALLNNPDLLKKLFALNMAVMENPPGTNADLLPHDPSPISP